MPAITGVNFKQARLEDFHRLYFCSPPGGKSCGTAPCTCSRPPCDKCYGDATPAPPKLGCAAGGEGIQCKPPKTPMGYKGQAWPTMTFRGLGEKHIFAIGDWGGMDGSLNPIEGRAPVVAYDWGKREGPSVFPRNRWDVNHSVELCDHKQLIECFNARGQPPCAASCGYVAGVDDQPQTLVANALRARASKKDPQYILNVGDNFYWGGIEKTCGTPMDEISFTAHHQFDQVFERVYQGTGLSGKPWLSVLGNHDWGGRVFNNGWDQQIAYTWASKRWIMPAPYWSQHVEYPDLLFSVDIYMLDSNFVDANDPAEDAEHNICSSEHNPASADCSIADGPSSIETCPQFFRDFWQEQQTWLEQLLRRSTATWQLVVTHFPCGHEQDWYKTLHQQMGLDLLVTGHRHDQEIWLPTDYARNHMGGLSCIVTGGGGGITSEATPDPTNKADWYGEGEYGFYDLTISRTEIKIESINWDGKIALTHTVYPQGPR